MLIICTDIILDRTRKRVSEENKQRCFDWLDLKRGTKCTVNYIFQLNLSNLILTNKNHSFNKIEVNILKWKYPGYFYATVMYLYLTTSVTIISILLYMPVCIDFMSNEISCLLQNYELSLDTSLIYEIYVASLCILYTREIERDFVWNKNLP